MRSAIILQVVAAMLDRRHTMGALAHAGRLTQKSDGRGHRAGATTLAPGGDSLHRLRASLMNLPRLRRRGLLVDTAPLATDGAIRRAVTAL